LRKLLSSQTDSRDPLTLALHRKARNGTPGGSESFKLAAGDGWRVVDIVCTSGPDDRPFEESHESTSLSLVRSGTFVYRGDRGSSLMSPGAILIGHAGRSFECSHDHGEGDRCLSFQFHRDLFARLAEDAGADDHAFVHHRLPPLRALAPIVARALKPQPQNAFEELALDFAAAVIEAVGEVHDTSPAITARDCARIADVVGHLATHTSDRHSLAELARVAGISRYHFLRTFRSVTGVTPHQWLLRARLRDAADRLVACADPITDIALDVGFDDLSNFIRSFHTEFGISPRKYRLQHGLK
jgi:AraC family transcriptional regulator